MIGALGHDSALFTLYWAEHNLGDWDELCYEPCPWRRIISELLASSPARYHCTTDASDLRKDDDRECNKKTHDNDEQWKQWKPKKQNKTNTRVLAWKTTTLTGNTKIPKSFITLHTTYTVFDMIWGILMNDYSPFSKNNPQWWFTTLKPQAGGL